MRERHAVVVLLLAGFLALPCPAAAQSVDEGRPMLCPKGC